MKQWPKIGSKVTFTGVQMFWFTNIVKNANELLELNKEYTISKLELASSWCAVILEEFPDKKFALSFFKYDKELTTQEVKNIQLDASETVKYEFTSLEELKKAVKHNKLTIEFRNNPHTEWYRIGVLENASYQEAKKFIEDVEKKHTTQLEYRILES